MRKILLCLGCVGTVGWTGAAAAQVSSPNSEIVYFNGRILNQTCQIDSSAKQLQVMLPEVRRGMLQKQGDTAGEKEFEIKLTGCTDGDDKPYIVFMANGMVDTSTGNLQNTVKDGAKNVQVQLLFAEQNQPIQLSASMAGKPSSVSASSGGGTVTLKYKARYYAKGAATAGSVQASVNYMIAYE